MLLCYTGSSRLARNLLQTVVRGWYQRTGRTVQTVDALCRNAQAMHRALMQVLAPFEPPACTARHCTALLHSAQLPPHTTDLYSLGGACGLALAQGDLSVIGECLNTYWAQKKALAGPSAEPPAIAELCAAFRPFVHGLSIGGAGGGGFVLLLTKLPAVQALPLLQAELDAFKTRYAASLASPSATAPTSTVAVAAGVPSPAQLPRSVLVAPASSEPSVASTTSQSSTALEELEELEPGADDILKARFYAAAIDTEGLRFNLE